MAGNVTGYFALGLSRLPENASGNALPSATTRTVRATASDFVSPLATTVSVCKPTLLTFTGKLTPVTCPGSSFTLVVVGPSAVYQALTFKKSPQQALAELSAQLTQIIRDG